MPTEAFFNLEEQKKHILLESAVAEFSALPYEKVSIFKIAQNAGVSRSGFYYYFKDKEDIYKYLIGRMQEEFMTVLEKEDPGQYDIFSFCERVFQFLVAIKGTEREAFFKRIIENARPSDMKDFLNIIESCTAENHFRYICDLDQLRPEAQGNITSLTWLLISSTIYALHRFFDGEEDAADAKKRLEGMFSMLKHGVMEEEKREQQGGKKC